MTITAAGHGETWERLPEEMTLAEVQNELRAISGTPYRDEADRLRRMALWRELDRRILQGEE